MSPLKLTISILLLLSTACLGIRFVDDSNSLNQFHITPIHRNEMHCSSSPSYSRIHISMTLDFEYLRGLIAAVNSILKHASCPDNIFFHFIASQSNPRVLNSLLHSIFPSLHFKLYVFNQDRVLNLISSSLRLALENPLNFARIYLADVLSIDRVIYLDSDIIVVDDIFKLWNVTLTGSRVIGAPEYCDANFTSYFTAGFWSDPVLSRVFSSTKPCYFNTGVMVMDLEKWRRGNCRKKIENWMEIQREKRIYELGSLPPFLLVFGGNIEGIDHRWNQHGLGGDNFKGNCRKMHYGPYSLLHWSGKGKPWVRLDANQPCPVDFLWEPYDLYKSSSSSSSSRIRRGNGHHLVGFSSPD